MAATQTIVVTITRDRLIEDTNEVIQGARVMRELRQRGVPVIGTLGIFSVEHGVLTVHTDDGLDGDEFVYTWVGVPVAPPLRKHHLTFTNNLKAIIAKEDEL